MTPRHRRQLLAAGQAAHELRLATRPLRLAAFYRWWWTNHRGLMIDWLHSPKACVPKLVLERYRATGARIGTRTVNP